MYLTTRDRAYPKPLFPVLKLIPGIFYPSVPQYVSLKHKKANSINTPKNLILKHPISRVQIIFSNRDPNKFHTLLLLAISLRSTSFCKFSLFVSLQCIYWRNLVIDFWNCPLFWILLMVCIPMNCALNMGPSIPQTLHNIPHKVYPFITILWGPTICQDFSVTTSDTSQGTYLFCKYNIPSMNMSPVTKLNDRANITSPNSTAHAFPHEVVPIVALWDCQSQCTQVDGKLILTAITNIRIINFCPKTQEKKWDQPTLGEGAKAMASLYWKEETLQHILSELVQGLSEPTGGAPACNGFHS